VVLCCAVVVLRLRICGMPASQALHCTDCSGVGVANTGLMPPSNDCMAICATH
jgi:hypothetical protein